MSPFQDLGQIGRHVSGNWTSLKCLLDGTDHIKLHRSDQGFRGQDSGRFTGVLGSTVDPEERIRLQILRTRTVLRQFFNIHCGTMTSKNKKGQTTDSPSSPSPSPTAC